MKHPRRWIFTALAALSLAIALICAVVCLRSFLVADRFTWKYKVANDVEVEHCNIHCSRGGIDIDRYKMNLADEAITTCNFVHETQKPEHDPSSNTAGFGYKSDGNSKLETRRQWIFPLAAPILLALILPAIWTFKRIRRR